MSQRDISLIMAKDDRHEHRVNYTDSDHLKDVKVIPPHISLKSMFSTQVLKLPTPLYHVALHLIRIHKVPFCICGVLANTKLPFSTALLSHR